MTVSSTTNRKEYAGNGATTSFATNPVVFFDDADLVVYVVNDTTGDVETLVLNTDYEVTGGASILTGGLAAVGTLDLDMDGDGYGAPASGTTLVIVRDLAITQESDFVNNDASDAQVAEASIDRLTMIAQQLDVRLDRSFALPDSDTSGASTELPTPVASTLIGWDSLGTSLQNYSSGELSAEIAVSAFMETVLDDANAVTARATLGVPSTTEAILGTIVDAKGDILAASAADTPARVAVGADGKVLTADSTAAAGVSWQAAGFTTGDVKLTLKTTADTGWVLMDDKTIGDASSGATGRANADTSALFTLLWTNTADADCAVSSGRGASAAADFAAHKTIALPKALGRALAVYGAGSGLTSRALAHVVGEETHTLTGAESGTSAHLHGKGTLAGSFPIDTTAGSGSALGVSGGATLTTSGHNDTTEATTITGSTANSAAADASSAHNNMQPTVFLNVMIKL